MSGQDTLPTVGGYAGGAWQFTGANDFNSLTFLAEQIVAGKAFAALVQVKAVHGGGASGAPPTVDVQPMVSQVDGLGNPVPHGVVYGLPCFRLQGGNGAVVLDPVVGDIGQAIICDRDISNVKATSAAATPGSFRQNDWADGLYLGGFLNAAPTTYVQMSGDNINIICPGTLTINAGAIVTTGTLTNNGKAVGSTHEHNAPSGGGTTSPPL